jgi:predicted MFS family arabinose efflux permease
LSDADLPGARVESRRDILVGVAVLTWSGGVATSMINLQPVLVNGLAKLPSFDVAMATRVTSAHLLGLFLGTILGAALVPRFRLRRLLPFASMTLSIGHLFTGLLHSALLLSMSQLLAGLGAGMAVAIGASAVATFQKPERIVALILTFEVLLGALHLSLSSWLILWIGIHGFFFYLAALTGSTLLIVRLFPEPTARISQNEKRSWIPLDRTAALMFAGLLICVVAQFGLWSQMAVLLDSKGIAEESIGATLGAGTLFALVGSAGAGAASFLLNWRWATILGILSSLAATIWLWQAETSASLVLAIGMLSIGLPFVIPFISGGFARHDPSGSLSAMAQPVTTAGIFVGSSLYSLLSGNTAAAVAASIAGYACAILLFAVLPMTTGQARAKAELIDRC